jgi:hypothetical protein
MLVSGFWMESRNSIFTVTLICKANYEDRRKAVAFARSMLDA